ncbi:uncharacterized protein LOC119180082 isoform X2 [Rhipicephalus microplus]|uniref:uncharacterized protein LOC119180082 isoform X2 n=1 Tax=Rhipicephalus microplus TaxID=6941 RepID=UPI003F6C4F33
MHAVCTGFRFNGSPSVYCVPPWVSFFVFLAMFLYGGDAFFKYKAWKSGEPAQGAEIGAQCRAWSFKRGVTYLPQLPCLLTMHATKSCTHPSGYDQLEGRVV